MLKSERLQKKRERNKEYDNFENLINPENLYNAFLQCRKGVRWKHSVQTYERRLLSNINETIELLKSGGRITKKTKAFYINERGKVRHIHSVHISERVIQKCLCDQVLIPILTPTLIYDNGASLRGKGLAFARKRLKQHLVSFYKKHKREGYVLTIDFSKYFDNINHDILMGLLRKEITDERILALIQQILDSFGEKGLYLGSQASQIFAIFHTSKLDHFIKEKLGIKYYGRYMDDSFALFSNKEELKEGLKQIKEVADSLEIKINEKKTKITKLTGTFNFLKCRYHLTNTGKVIMRPYKKNISRFKTKLKKMKKMLDNKQITHQDLRCLYASWRGYIKPFTYKKSKANIDQMYMNLFFNPSD